MTSRIYSARMWWSRALAPRILGPQTQPPYAELRGSGERKPKQPMDRHFDKWLRVAEEQAKPPKLQGSNRRIPWMPESGVAAQSSERINARGRARRKVAGQ